MDAPRALVFEAMTKCEHLKRWMGPRNLTMVSCETDLRVGGRYRFVFRAPDGNDVGFSGEFREVVRPERVVRTFVFEPIPDAAALETLELTEVDGRPRSPPRRCTRPWRIATGTWGAAWKPA